MRSSSASSSFTRAGGTESININKDISPMTLLVPRTIQKQPCSRPLRVLMDTGSDYSHIKRDALPLGATPSNHDLPITSNTFGDTVTNSQFVTLADIRLPEFHTSRRIDSLRCEVFDAPCNYDIILGRDFLDKIGLKIDFGSSKSMTWLDTTALMKPKRSFDTPEGVNAYLSEWLDTPTSETDNAPLFAAHFEMELSDYNTYISEMKEAKYEKVSIDQVIQQQTHLSSSQGLELHAVLSKYTALFSGKLGKYPHRKMHLELLKEDTPLVHKRAYSVPHAHEDLFNQELKHLCEIGVLEKKMDAYDGSRIFVNSISSSSERSILFLEFRTSFLTTFIQVCILRDSS
jgi:hypothetical protein